MLEEGLLSRIVEDIDDAVTVRERVLRLYAYIVKPRQTPADNVSD